jgi:hypothetical protein
MRRREGQAQFLLRVSQNFRAALAFSDELALAILHRLRCLARRSLRAKAARSWDHVTLNCFDGSAHMFLFSVNNDRPRTALVRKTMFLASA